MWHLTIPTTELILRGTLVYILLIVLLRISGKRQIGQMAPFDLVLLLVLSNSIQNAMNGGDNSVTAGVISAITLVGLNHIIGTLTFRSKKIEALIEGRPDVLIHNGNLFTDVMKRSHLTHHELNAALRGNGCASIQEVHYAILENNGQITVQKRSQPPSTIPER